jgi:hypothetical protein
MKEGTQVMKRLMCAVSLFLLSLWTVLLPARTFSAAKSAAEVRAAVTTWVRHVTADARPDAFVLDVEPYRVDGRSVAYIAHLSVEGFCLCGGDELLLPVYFYSPRGRYDAANTEYRFILEGIAAQDAIIRKAREQGIALTSQQQQALSNRAQQWRDLAGGFTTTARAGPTSSSSEPLMMVLDMNSLWSQVSPYNDLCPVLTPGTDEHCVAGCVATAMAQVMYYWKWPSSGTGSAGKWRQYRWSAGSIGEFLAGDPGIPQLWAGGKDRLQWTPSNGGVLIMSGYWDASLRYYAEQINSSTAYRSALQSLWSRLTPDSTWYSTDFAASTYDWSVMQDKHVDPVDDGDGEAAKISYHAGMASNTTYALGLSGSDTTPMRDGLVDHMRFDPDAVERRRDDNLIVEEITWLRPVLAGGYSPDAGGHEWIIFGYNKQTSPWQFKMNLGLDGTPAGWFSLDEYTFNIAQDQVLQLAPAGTVRFVGGAVSPGDGSPGDPYQTLDQALVQVSNGTTLIMKAGSSQTLSGGQLTRPMILKGKDVTILP